MMITQQMNYEYYHLCRNTRDLDISAAQLLAMHVGPCQFLCQLVDSFGLWPYLFADRYQGKFCNDDDADKLVRLAESMMRLLAVVATELPIASSLPIECNATICGPLRREMIHKLACAPCAFSELHDSKFQVACHGTQTCGTKEVEATIKAVAVKKEGS